jgi:hypothetical protein
VVVIDEALQEPAILLRQRNDIDERIARLTDRPMTAGHLGEYIAAKIFDIQLEDSASAPGIDGRIRSGPLAGRTVNVKWYLKQEGVWDVSLSNAPDYYLVFTGPRSATMSSKGGTRPWRIDAVYLFDSKHLLADLTSRGVKIGVAKGVRNALWEPLRSTRRLLIRSSCERAAVGTVGPLRSLTTAVDEALRPWRSSAETRPLKMTRTVPSRLTPEPGGYTMQTRGCGVEVSTFAGHPVSTIVGTL